LVKDLKIKKISKKINKNFTKINYLFTKQQIESSNLIKVTEESIGNKEKHKLNKENSLQDLLVMQTQHGSCEEVLLQSLEKNRTSNTFYSTNCISNSEKSLFNFNERESFNFENNFNAYNNFNFNSFNNNNFDIDNNTDNHNFYSLNSIRKSPKADENLVSNLNNVFYSIEKEVENQTDNYNYNHNIINNSGYTVNCKLSEEKEACKNIKFAIPFDDLNENALDITVDIINEKNKEININNNYNLEVKKHMNVIKEESKKNSNKKKEDEKKSNRNKDSIKNNDAVTRKLESGKIYTLKNNYFFK
jgi:hypothetical protein